VTPSVLHSAKKMNPSSCVVHVKNAAALLFLAVTDTKQPEEQPSVTVPSVDPIVSMVKNTLQQWELYPSPS
jgi:hypothetical protein